MDEIERRRKLKALGVTNEQIEKYGEKKAGGMGGVRNAFPEKKEIPKPVEDESSPFAGIFEWLSPKEKTAPAAEHSPSPINTDHPFFQWQEKSSFKKRTNNK